MPTLLANRQHKLGLIVIMTALGICSLIISFYNSTGFDLYLVSTSYVLFAYGLFAVLIWLQIIGRYKFQRLTQIPCLQTALTLVAGSCLLMVLEDKPQYRLLFNSASILIYALLLFYMVSYITQKVPLSIKQMDLQQRKFYLLYLMFLLMLFLITLSMDASDPFGPHFQLRVVFWLLLLHLLLSWIVQLWAFNQQLQNERNNTELMLLKSQINPHFFFNTLNNLYGLAREKSDQTPDLILRLADMMRYTIYQGQRDSVSLQQEMDYLNNYIALQQVRFSKQVQVRLNAEVPPQQQHLQLPPLLFINLLENAYKHGVEKLADHAFVDIALFADEQQLTFSVENNFDPEESNEIPGIGLANLRKRLALHYPDQHQLEIRQTKNCYSAKLTLSLEQEKTKEI